MACELEPHNAFVQAFVQFLQLEEFRLEFRDLLLLDVAGIEFTLLRAFDVLAALRHLPQAFVNLRGLGLLSLRLRRRPGLLAQFVDTLTVQPVLLLDGVRCVCPKLIADCFVGILSGLLCKPLDIVCKESRRAQLGNTLFAEVLDALGKHVLIWRIDGKA